MSSRNKKILVFGVIFLFISLTFTSVTNALNNISKKEKSYDVEITEYKSDGSIGKNIFKLTKAEITELKKDLLTAKTNERKFMIFKDKGLISKDIKFSDLKQGMYQMGEQMGFLKNMDPSKVKIRLPILLTLFTSVIAVYFGGISLSIGLSPIMRLLNLPGIDISNFVGGLFGITRTEGIFNKQTLIIFPGFSKMIGFVGFSFKIPATLHIFIGFSVATIGFGFGLKLKEWIF